MDFTKPVVGDAYTGWSTTIIQNMTDLGKQFDGVATMIGVPTGTIRFNSTTKRWEKWDSAAWVELLLKASETYDIRVADSISLNGQAASYYLALANASGTLPVAQGGTDISTYVIGDIIFASAAGVLSKLADVATGNVLLSGGVGVAPSYGKVALGTHISGTLAPANGGTGLSAFTAGDFINALNSTTLQTRTPAQVKTALSLVKADVGLGSVDNTADSAKPVSTAQQAALDLKAPKSPPLVQKNAAYSFVAADNNKIYYTDDATGNWAWTVSNAVHAAGDIISGYNDKGTSGNITLTQGASFTILWGTTTGTRTIARGGSFTLVFKTASKAYLTGSGIT